MLAMVIAGVGWLVVGAAVMVAGSSSVVDDTELSTGMLIVVAVAFLAPANVAVIAWFSRFKATAWVFTGLAISGLALGGLVLLMMWGRATA